MSQRPMEGLNETNIVNNCSDLTQIAMILIDASLHLSACKSFAVWTCAAQCCDIITLT